MNSQLADKALRPPSPKLALLLRAAPWDPAVTGPPRPWALGGHADEDGTTGQSLGW